MAANPVPLPDRHEQLIENEQGLARQLSERQLSMIAIGGAIGTGLFLGSALAVRTAGPGVVLSYLFASGIALLLMYCLSEMAVAHPTAGSFGLYADLYISPWAGFVVRYTYWAAQSVAIGGEAVAAAIYTQWWFPGTPAWMWVLFYSAVLIFVNARSVGAFGEFEYWFSMIKVSAIVVFIVLGAAILFGIHQQRPIGLDNFRANGGFLPQRMDGRLAGDDLRYLQLHWNRDCRRHRRRGEESGEGRATRDANHAGAAGDFLHGRDHHPGWSHSLDPDPARTRASRSARSSVSST